MKEVIENMKTVLLDGMPNLFHGTPLSQLPESHPEVLTQKVLVEWNHDHRFMLRRLTLAIMRYMDGPGRSFELNEVDECLFAVLILDDELLEEHPELAFNPSLH